ncbi:MAG: hypothetical protein U9Q04_05800 [Campylobacterota bacterium]|nr:hypothetical protein [Campylobacterota bacterium]
MKINSLSDIVEGKLLNSPAISFITQIHTNVKKVNEGDAFFAFCEKEIKEALKNGAFAIITQFEPNITDDEIAWIKVDDILKAITNTLRYKLLKHNHTLIKVDKILYRMIKHFIPKNNENTTLLSNNILNDFETLYSIKSEQIVYSTNMNILKAISPDIKVTSTKDYKVQNLTCHSLFETSFSYDGIFYDKVKLPYHYINYFLELGYLINDTIETKKINTFDLFKPLFINKSSQMVPFGQTNRFIIANKDHHIAQYEIDYLQEHYKYGDIKTLEARSLEDDELFKIIKLHNYNALYIIGKNIDSVTKILQQNDKSYNLF